MLLSWFDALANSAKVKLEDSMATVRRNLEFLGSRGTRLPRRMLLLRRHLIWLRDSLCFMYGLEDGLVSSGGQFLVALVPFLVV